MKLLYKSISKNEYDEVRELLFQDIETSEEFLWALENEPKTLTVVYMEGKIVAVARIIPGGKVSCLIVFVALKYRCKGIGQAVVQHCGDELHKESGKIMTNFHGDNEVAKRFAKRLGYERQFSSACMKHTEGKFEIGSVSVRTDLQGHGIGKKFVMYLCNEIYNPGYKEVVLWCVVGNNARKLYDSLGFRELYVAEFAYKRIHPHKIMNI